MPQSSVFEEIKELRDALHRHNHLYYVANKPEISDQEFDAMLLRLEQLEAKYPEFFDETSPTQRVGSDLTNEFEHVVHKRAMMSLSNSYNIEEVDQWFDRVDSALSGQKFQVVGELKFDGTSISLHYKGGKLVRAVTRGDGTQGDDVTANVCTIRSIPLQLQAGSWPDEFEIRGEILMPWAVFEKLNAERAYNEEPLFANPRNAASGSLKLKDSKEVAARHLDARFYYLLADKLPSDSHYDNMLEAASWGFKVSKEMALLETREDVDAFIARWDEERRRLPVATDGLVFKVNSLRQQLNLGFRAKSPRWAIAYKFNPERERTLLKFVSFETGRMGIVTPVANLEPVLLSGTVVKRASLHNDDIIKELDLHEHDYVYVEKGGEIIPKIVGVDKNSREAGSRQVEFVKFCPECGTELVRMAGEAAWRCPNMYGCGPQIAGRIEHFCSRRMMDINGIGEQTAQLLYRSGLVTHIRDLYSLTVEDLRSVLMKDPDLAKDSKISQSIIDGIRESANVPFERVLYALSIPNVGETTAKRLAASVKSMERLQAMSIEELQAVEDIGPVIGECIYEYLRQPENVANIEVLRAHGVQMELSADRMSNASDKLAAKSIVISGTFEHHSRDEYKEMIERHGGKNVGSISKKTSFVLAGENMGPAKLEKCQKFGIPLVNENDFLEMLKQ